MTEQIQNLHTRTLYDLALDDLSTMQYPLPDAIYGFHAQQACEKFLKSLISSAGSSYPFIHSLEALEESSKAAGELLPALPYRLSGLEPYAVQLRYDFGSPLSEETREQMKETCNVLRHHVIARIIALEAAHP